MVYTCGKVSELINSIVSVKDQGLTIDVILLCETYLTDANEQHCNIPGYRLMTKNRKVGTCGGVAIRIC